MQGRLENEPFERGRRHLHTGSVILLLCAIAVAAAIGIVMSLGQRPATHNAPPLAHAPAPLQPTLPPTLLTNQPESGTGFSIASDPAAHDVVLFGGVGDYPNTWLWNGSSWTLADPASSPAGRFGASAAYDPQLKSVVMFGGRLEDGTPIHDTWAWNGSTWTDLDSGAGGPPPGAGSPHCAGSRPSEPVLRLGFETPACSPSPMTAVHRSVDTCRRAQIARTSSHCRRAGLAPARRSCESSR